ncbi:DegT/DnrJ/EryC1/StrS aminotransferase family protein [bacterium]|jgi:hypothetical protein|nr:DegT/DnrJ/EryC1/StrS aminotransferase family protein [bacterium]
MRIYKHRPNLVLDTPKASRNDIENLFGSKYFYKLPSGKSSIFHALQAWKIKKKNILVPYYVCDDVISSIELTGNVVVLCDIDTRDLNVSYESVSNVCSVVEIAVLVVPSLYGNSANIEKISDFCKKKNIKLLNDCAQACGATLNGKSLLKYGDAAFVSFSVGKPLFGFSGAYMSMDSKILNRIKLNNTSNIYYLLIMLSYIFSRVLIEWRISRLIGKFFLKTSNLWIKYTRISLYNVCTPVWVDWYNMKLLSAQLNLKFQFRQDFIDHILDSKYYRVIRHVRGNPVGFRLILLFFEKKNCEIFSIYLAKNKIYHSFGYNVSSFQFDSAHLINERIIDIPIDYNKKKREYLKSILDRYS